jgi:quercetin dioxygenase-like cupin family protein
MRKGSIVIAVLAAAAFSAPIVAQPPSGIKRTMLQKVDVPGTNYETVTAIAEVSPNTSAGRHTHPGPETGYVVEGSFLLLVEGRAPMTLNAGDSYQIPAGTVHDVKTTDKPMKVMAVYIVEKGKPLASPAL